VITKADLQTFSDGELIDVIENAKAILDAREEEKGGG